MFICFEKISNARDLGGIAAAGGRRVKPGLLLRSASLAHATEEDILRLSEEYKLRHIIDFRDGSEVEANPDKSVPGARHHALPALPSLPGGGGEKSRHQIPPDFAPLFRRIYTELAETEEAIGAYREFFRILLARDGAVLWHCTQGKDRTGVAGLLLLSALGVSWEDALADYLLSNEGLRPEYEALFDKGLSEEELVKLKKLYFVYPEFLSVYTDAVGDMESYLTRRIGLNGEDIRTLREFYTE